MIPRSIGGLPDSGIEFFLFFFWLFSAAAAGCEDFPVEFKEAFEREAESLSPPTGDLWVCGASAAPRRARVSVGGDEVFFR